MELDAKLVLVSHRWASKKLWLGFLVHLPQLYLFGSGVFKKSLQCFCSSVAEAVVSLSEVELASLKRISSSGLAGWMRPSAGEMMVLVNELPLEWEFDLELELSLEQGLWFLEVEYVVAVDCSPISILLLYTFYQPVSYAIHNQSFPSTSEERAAFWVVFL